MAFAKTDDVKAGRWQIFDITTEMLEVPGFFMDFPDLAVGANFIYMTPNCFGPDGKTVGSTVVICAARHGATPFDGGVTFAFGPRSDSLSTTNTCQGDSLFLKVDAAGETVPEFERPEELAEPFGRNW